MPSETNSSATMEPFAQPLENAISNPALNDNSSDQTHDKASEQDATASKLEPHEKKLLEPALPKTKKKKSKRPKRKQRKIPPSGFEEYFVDAPLTPDDYEYEREIYKKERPIIFRIQEALNRYQAKRKIDNQRMQVFSRYLIYGGVDVGPKMFGGISEAEMREMDKDNLTTARSQTSIKSDRLNLKIDFDAVVRGFLTSYFQDYFNPDSEEVIKLATSTIKNFLNYLIYHDVCPEHKDNINAARVSCDIAAKQLWDNHRLMANGPGDLNKACSKLYGGYHYDPEGTEENSWTDENITAPQITVDIATKVVKFALASAGSDEQASQYRNLSSKNELSAARIEDIDGIEVTGVNLPDKELREFYNAQAPDLRVVGKLRAKPYLDPARPEMDLSPEERLTWDQKWDELVRVTEFEFLVEEDLLRFCYPGMKIWTTVWRLNCGLYFFDHIYSAYCAIYTVLVNDLMIGWKKPRPHPGKKDDEEKRTGEEAEPKKLEDARGADLGGGSDDD